MNKHGGFEHNLQSLRVVDLLEEKYADFPGLNLSFETREGILKHCSRNNARKLGELGERFLNGTHPSLEAQIANIADEIAYGNHDVDDGVRSGLITIEQLCDCTLFKESHDQVLKQYGTLDQSRQINEIKRRMINLMVENLVENSQRLIDAAGVKSINDVRTANSQLISLTDAMREYHIEMKQFLRNNLYHHEHVKKMTDNAKVVIRSLFESYSNNPENLPEQLNSSSTNTELFRHISDYIAGMTDRFAISEYKRITQDDFDIYEL
jgi:dGTPase